MRPNCQAWSFLLRFCFSLPVIHILCDTSFIGCVTASLLGMPTVFAVLATSHAVVKLHLVQISFVSARFARVVDPALARREDGCAAQKECMRGPRGGGFLNTRPAMIVQGALSAVDNKTI
jgi:hypothetical protein